MDLKTLKEKAKAAVDAFEAKSAGDHGFKKKLGEFFDHLLGEVEAPEATAEKPAQAAPAPAPVQDAQAPKPCESCGQ